MLHPEWLLLVGGPSSQTRYLPPVHLLGLQSHCPVGCYHCIVSLWGHAWWVVGRCLSQVYLLGNHQGTLSVLPGMRFSSGTVGALVSVVNFPSAMARALWSSAGPS